MSSNLSATATATINLPCPVGTVISYMGSQQSVASLASLGWLLCDNSSVSSQTYPELYGLIGTTYGGSNTQFNLPMLSGVFLRGVDPTGEIDPDSSSRTSPNYTDTTTVVGPLVGSRQKGEVQNHQHNWNRNFGNIGDGGNDIEVQLGSGGYESGNRGTEPTTLTDGGGAETRPYNVYVYFLIFAGIPQPPPAADAAAEKKTGGGRTASEKKPGTAKSAEKKTAAAKKTSAAKKR